MGEDAYVQVNLKNLPSVNMVLATFSEVFKGKHKATKANVALKKVIMDKEKEGVSIETIDFSLQTHFETFYLVSHYCEILHLYF